jgi:hypothetical protein
VLSIDSKIDIHVRYRRCLDTSTHRRATSEWNDGDSTRSCEPKQLRDVGLACWICHIVWCIAEAVVFVGVNTVSAFVVVWVVVWVVVVVAECHVVV